jgi:hypothetical protein
MITRLSSQSKSRQHKSAQPTIRVTNSIGNYDERLQVMQIKLSQVGWLQFELDHRNFNHYGEIAMGKLRRITNRSSKNGFGVL